MRIFITIRRGWGIAIWALGILIWLAGSIFPSTAQALFTPHPTQLYERGAALLNSYRGEAAQINEAQKYFVEIIDKYPDSPWGYLGMSRTYLIDAYLYGNQYNMKKIQDLALPFAVKALELGPSLRQVHEHYALFEKIFDQFQADQNFAKEYLLSFPDKAETYLTLGNFMRDQEEYARALEFYQMALELEPSDATRIKVLTRIALLYLNEYQQPQNAVEYFLQALSLNKNSPLLNEYLGVAYLKMNRYQQAIENLSRSLQAIKLTTPEYYLMLAQGYMAEEQGKLPQAIDYLEQASRSGMGTSTLYYRLGNLYFKNADYEKAYRHFKRVIDIKPEESSAYYFAGRSAHSLGQEDMAINFYKKYLQLNAESEEARWIRENIPEFSQK